MKGHQVVFIHVYFVLPAPSNDVKQCRNPKKSEPPNDGRKGRARDEHREQSMKQFPS